MWEVRYRRVGRMVDNWIWVPDGMGPTGGGDGTHLENHPYLIFEWQPYWVWVNVLGGAGPGGSGFVGVGGGGQEEYDKQVEANRLEFENSLKNVHSSDGMGLGGNPSIFVEPKQPLEPIDPYGLKGNKGQDRQLTTDQLYNIDGIRAYDLDYNPVKQEDLDFKSLHDSLLKLAKKLDDKKTRELLDAIKKACPDLGSLIDCLESHPWMKVPFLIDDIGVIEPPLTDLSLDDEDGYPLSKDKNGRIIALKGYSGKFKADDKSIDPVDYNSNTKGAIILKYSLIQFDANYEKINGKYVKRQPPLSFEDQLRDTLCHELVHACGGGEIEAYALEQTLFGGPSIKSDGPIEHEIDDYSIALNDKNGGTTNKAEPNGKSVKWNKFSEEIICNESGKPIPGLKLKFNL